MLTVSRTLTAPDASPSASVGAVVVRTPAPLAGLSGAGEALLATWFAGKDAATVRAYSRDLTDFAQYAGALNVGAALEALLALAPGEANALALHYRGALLASGKAPATVNRHLAALRSVVKLARVLGRITWALEVAGVEAVAYRDTRGPGATGFRALVRMLEQRTDAKGRRDLAIVRLLFDRGLRRQEVVTLDVAHYDRTAHTLAVMGKKRRSRELLTIPTPTVAALEAWLAVRGLEPGPLFTNCDRAGKGERLTGRSIARITGAAGESAGIGAVRPHGLRHAAITHALDVAAGDTRRVAKFSRHRNLNTLLIYDDARTDDGGAVASLVAGVA